MPGAATLKGKKKSLYSMHPSFDYEEAGLRLIKSGWQNAGIALSGYNLQSET